MKNSKLLPNINDFLEIIDPDKTIDRNHLTLNLGAIVMASAVNQIRTTFSEFQNKELDQIINIKSSEMPNKVLIYLKKIGRLDEFIKLINRFTIEVKKDYIKTHLDALTEQKRSEVFEKFPKLKKDYQRK